MDADIQYDEGPWLMMGEDLQADSSCDISDHSAGVPVSLQDTELPSDRIQKLTVGTLGGVLGLPERHLQHQRLSDLYWLFQGSWERLAECLDEQQQARMSQCPSYTTFRRAWRRKWRRALKFRKVSQHSQCQTCSDLLQQLHKRGAAWADRMRAAAALKRHHQDQYLDRCIYWSLRFASRAMQDVPGLGHCKAWAAPRHARFSTSSVQCPAKVLVIILDSMDRTKFAWPRWSGRVPKRLEGCIRPRLVLTAAIAHGYLTKIFLSNENVFHGAAAFLEMLPATQLCCFHLGLLSYVLAACFRSSRQFVTN